MKSNTQPVVNVETLTGVMLAYWVAIAEGLAVTLVMVDGELQCWLKEDISAFHNRDGYINRQGEPRFVTEDGPVGLFGNPFELSWELCGEILERRKIRLAEPVIDTQWTAQKRDAVGRSESARDAVFLCYLNERFGRTVPDVTTWINNKEYA